MRQTIRISDKKEETYRKIVIPFVNPTVKPRINKVFIYKKTIQTPAQRISKKALYRKTYLRSNQFANKSHINFKLSQMRKLNIKLKLKHQILHSSFDLFEQKQL